MKNIYLDPPIKTKTIEFTSTTLERAWDDYLALVDDYAAKIFEKYIKPWMIKNRCIFLVGNGTWYLEKRSKSGKEIMLDCDTVPDFIGKWLNMPIPGLDYNTLGTMMPDYDYRKGE